MLKRQLELSLGRAPGSEQRSSRTFVRSSMQHRRQNRADWWFDRMRRVVDDALEQQSDPRRMP
jgi:hypothetical protein